MKELKFLLILLFVFCMGLSVIFGFRLFEMEQNAKGRYLNTNVAINYTRDKVSSLDRFVKENWEYWSLKPTEKRIIEQIKRSSVYTVMEINKTIQNDIHYYSRDKWPEYREIFEEGE